MARAMHPDSAGSQFFIMHKTSPHLDGAYAAFGKITEGMDVVNKIAETATDYSDRPLAPQVMKKVTVETFGVGIRNQRSANAILRNAKENGLPTNAVCAGRNVIIVETGTLRF